MVSNQSELSQLWWSLASNKLCNEIDLAPDSIDDLPLSAVGSKLSFYSTTLISSFGSWMITLIESEEDHATFQTISSLSCSVFLPQQVESLIDMYLTAVKGQLLVCPLRRYNPSYGMPCRVLLR